MIKLSGKQLYVTDSMPIKSELKILHVLNDKIYTLVCNQQEYKLIKDNDYLIWKIPDSVSGEVQFSVKAYDRNKKLLYETNTVSVEIQPLFSAFAKTMASTFTTNAITAIGETEAVEEHLIYDMADQHPVIPVNNRTITMPTDYEIVVSRDNLSQLLTFELDRFFDGVDLTLKIPYIKYINSEQNEGKSIAVNMDYDETKVRVGWLIDENAAFKSGLTVFAIEFIGYNEYGLLYRWQTIPAYLRVAEGLWINDEIVEQQYPSIIEDLMIRVNQLEVNNGGSSDGGSFWSIISEDNLNSMLSGTNIMSPGVLYAVVE